MSQEDQIDEEDIFCAICSARASGRNFNVLTCTSCKAFFRRNGNRAKENFLCRFAGRCSITEKTRRHCTACRIEKCFRVGMKKDRIRTEQENQRHRALIEENRRERLRKLQIQQNEKLQILLNYDFPKSFFNGRKFLDQIEVLGKVFHDVFERTKNEISSISFDDDLSQVFNSHCLPISNFIIFLKELNHFQCLNTDERLLLFKSNSLFLCPMLINVYHNMFDVPIIMKSFGQQQINRRLLEISYSFNSIYSHDRNVILLSMIVLIFSPSLSTRETLRNVEPMRNSSIRLIHRAYEQYGQYLWQYLLRKFQDDQRQAQRNFHNLIGMFLKLQRSLTELFDESRSRLDADRLHPMIQSILY